MTYMTDESACRDELAVWQLDVQNGSVKSRTLVHFDEVPLPKGSGRLTCMACNDVDSGLLIMAGKPLWVLLHPSCTQRVIVPCY